MVSKIAVALLATLALLAPLVSGQDGFGCTCTVEGGYGDCNTCRCELVPKESTETDPVSCDNPAADACNPYECALGTVDGNEIGTCQAADGPTPCADDTPPVCQTGGECVVEDGEAVCGNYDPVADGVNDSCDGGSYTGNGTFVEGCTRYECQEGECVLAPINGGEPCTPGGATTVNEDCQEATCTTAGECQVNNINEGGTCTLPDGATAATCKKAACDAGACKEVPDDTATCNDGDACNGPDVCDGGECVPEDSTFTPCNQCETCVDGDGDAVDGYTCEVRDAFQSCTPDLPGYDPNGPLECFCGSTGTCEVCITECPTAKKNCATFGADRFCAENIASEAFGQATCGDVTCDVLCNQYCETENINYPNANCNNQEARGCNCLGAPSVEQGTTFTGPCCKCVSCEGGTPI